MNRCSIDQPPCLSQGSAWQRQVFPGSKPAVSRIYPASIIDTGYIWDIYGIYTGHMRDIYEVSMHHTGITQGFEPVCDEAEGVTKIVKSF